jgi:hypothetical protein
MSGMKSACIEMLGDALWTDREEDQKELVRSLISIQVRALIYEYFHEPFMAFFNMKPVLLYVKISNLARQHLLQMPRPRKSTTSPTRERAVPFNEEYPSSTHVLL